LQSINGNLLCLLTVVEIGFILFFGLLDSRYRNVCAN
jgi:hypothetical protein